MSCSRFLSIGALASVSVLLGACGEGWEPRMVRNKVPYAEERTAGVGVEYVRAHMLQERGPKLEPELPQSVPVEHTMQQSELTVEQILNLPPPEEPIRQSDDLFKGIQVK